ncbi:MAG: hypothetical protein ABFC34_11680 [Methanobacterium sp.]
MDEFRELKVGFQNLQYMNKELIDQISDVAQILKEDKELKIRSL